MSRTAWIIVIVLVVLVLLFVVYKYMFNKNKPEISTTVNNNGGFTVPVVSTVNNESETTSVNQDIEIPNVQSSLHTVLQTLGYYVTVDESGNVKAIGSPSESKSSLIKTFAIRFNGTNNMFGNNVDINKWKEYVSSGLENIDYSNKDNKKASEIYNKIVSYWGSSFFNVAAQKIIESSRNANKINVDCNSQEYKDKLLRLKINFQQAGNAYQIAVFNINKVDNAETTQALKRTSQALKIAEEEYKKYFALCNKS